MKSWVGYLNYEMEKASFEVQEGDVVVFLNRFCDHRVTKLEAASSAKPDTLLERKVLAFFIADPSKSTMPVSKNMKLNQKLDKKEKDSIYLKKHHFMRSLILSDIKNELDYTEDFPKAKDASKEITEEACDDSTTFKVTIGTADGKFHSIDCSSTDTLNDLMTKCQIKCECDSKTDELPRIFNFEDQSYRDGNTTLAQCGINGKNSSKILFFRSSRHIMIN